MLQRSAPRHPALPQANAAWRADGPVSEQRHDFDESDSRFSNLQGPADWNPAPTDIRETCKKAVEHAAKKGVELPVLAIKSSVANPDISTHLVG